MVDSKEKKPAKTAKPKPAKKVEAVVKAAAATAAATPVFRRREIVGIVVSDKMNKTISVEVVRQVRHRLYKKYFTRNRYFKAHDEKGEAKMGDLVQIIETRPISKTKRWALKSILRKGAKLVDKPEELSGGVA